MRAVAGAPPLRRGSRFGSGRWDDQSTLRPGDFVRWVEEVRARVEVDRTQLEAYARAVAREEGFPEERVESALVFLRREFVVRL